MISPNYTEIKETTTSWNQITIAAANATKYAENNLTVIDKTLKVSLCNDSNKSSDDCVKSVTEFDGVQFSFIVLLFFLIVIIVIGNTLIIAAVVTTKKLRTVTNCFVTSLAAADLLVGVFVMPPAIAVHVRGKWELGWVLCDIWISLDILLCTASILSLCAISVDRYLAVTRPLTYSRRRRSKKLALTMILCVWLAATAITCPPIFGWYEPSHNQDGICRYNQNPGYVVFSAMGSFFLPMAVMVYVYARISCVVARRHQQLSTSNARCNKKSKLTCVRAESDSGSEKLSLKKTPSINHSSISRPSKPLSGCSSCEKSPCCDKADKINKKDIENAKIFQSEIGYRYKSNRASCKRTRSMKEHENNRVSSLRRETKTAQTLSFVVGGFVACWLPFFLYYILTPFLPVHFVNPILMSFLTWLGWFNSAINPFIYAFYSPDFRLAFWRLTIKKFIRKS